MGTIVIERTVLHRLIADGTSGVVRYQRRYNELGLPHSGQPIGQTYGFPVPKSGAGALTAALGRRLEGRGGRCAAARR
ncbi:hypothetical protein [Streptomyces xanthochromogenes]|uniref:hypothetical protein n=1 Tax=Streptomyces xanthochromogenes TaxID=67384 RepID=UPI0034184F09